MRTWFIEKVLNGYASVDSAIDAIRDTKDESARARVLSLAVKKLYNTIGQDDILRFELDAKGKPTGHVYHRGKQLSMEEVKGLRAEAQLIRDQRLWKLLTTDVKYQANRKMYLLSQDILDVTAGKLWTYTIDAIETVIKRITEITG